MIVEKSVKLELDEIPEAVALLEKIIKSYAGPTGEKISIHIWGPHLFCDRMHPGSIHINWTDTEISPGIEKSK